QGRRGRRYAVANDYRSAVARAVWIVRVHERVGHAGRLLQLRPKRVERSLRRTLSPAGAGQPREQSTPAVPGLQYGDVRDGERPISTGARAADQFYVGNSQ